MLRWVHIAAGLIAIVAGFTRVVREEGIACCIAGRAMSLSLR